MEDSPEESKLSPSAKKFILRDMRLLSIFI
uniref:Uncharacterized protein n=1 Tax=Arundo donax TaxID=35708 RepID=A0A0A9HFA4_ARUDO